MKIRREFIALQLQFAQAMAQRCGLPLADALLAGTNLYVRFGLGRGFDAGHPVWHAYVAGLPPGADPIDWTWNFHQSRLPDGGAAEVPIAVETAEAVGCFAFEHVGERHLRLHFSAAADAPHAPLAADRADLRRNELHALLARARHTMAPDAVVLGTSWLYHLAAYRRLFPPAYLASAREVGPRLRNMSLWGQFIDRHGALRQPAAAALLERAAACRHVDQLPGCFALRPLALEAPLSAFADVLHRR